MARSGRLPARSNWLMLGFVVLWGVCFFLSIDTALRRASFPLLLVAAAPEAGGYPILTGFRPSLAPAASDLRLGDRLIRVGEADMGGAGPLEFLGKFVEQIGDDARVEVEFERAGERRTTRVRGGSTRFVLALLPASLVFLVAALILWLRAWHSRMARAFTAWFAIEALFLAGQFLGGVPLVYAAFAVHTVTMTLTGPLSLRALLLFPEDPAAAVTKPRWPWAFAVLGLLHTGQFGWPVPYAVGAPAAALVVALLLASAAVIVTRAYRRSDPIGRRQIKWVCFGVYCAAMPLIAAAVTVAIVPALAPVYFVSLAAVAFIPAALLISIIRFNLFDIDRLISATLSYNVLLAIAITVAAATAPAAAQAGVDLLGVDPWVGRFALLVPLGLLVIVVHGSLRPRIEQVLFAERHALDTGIEQLLAELSGGADMQALTLRLGEGLYRLFRPVACVIYARAEDRFAPLSVHGDTVPATFESDGPLVVTLRQRLQPLAFGPFDSGPRVELTPFQRAVLETLDAAVVLPIARGDDLTLVLCMGPKRSGDVYTSTDLHLLATLADKARGQMERFEQGEVISQSRRMQESLRRYVPGAVAKALGAGRELAPVERDVTVLFVDLRGFTAFCEPRRPEEIFATVASYTEAVSAILLRLGGTLVEFNGDGMMAMFGAPDPLPGKERAAVQGARDIVASMASMAPPAAGTAPMSVGLGIASGPAFVGNIRSADRLIWTAIGNTVNLAARLQALTRDIGAQIAIDRRTHAAAGTAAEGFLLLESVAIRGRGEREDVFVLPLKPSGGR